MYRACLFEVGDDLYTTLANCKNLADDADRRACQEDARVGRREGAASCGEVHAARQDACELLGEERYAPDPLLDPANVFIDPDDIYDGSKGSYDPSPYVSLVAGHTYVLRAGDEGEETVVVHVTDESREILGVLCRVVIDVVLEVSEEEGEIDYEAVEVTDDWFAQDTESNVYYCGEVARNFEDGVLRNLDGSFEAGIDFAKSGNLIRHFPVPGNAHRQEFALGEAEDIVQYVDLDTSPTEEEGGENASFPCGNACLKTLEFAPLEPESSEYKYYLPGVGFVLAVAMEDGEITGEREALVCVGDSLDVLASSACASAIPDPAMLLEEICVLAPDAFCAATED